MSTAARWFRYAAIAETISWIGLLIGMLFKYVVVFDEIGVQVFGPVHGAMFVLYVATLIRVAVTDRWPPSWRIAGLVAAIPPFTGLIFERWAEARQAVQSGSRPR